MELDRIPQLLRCFVTEGLVMDGAIGKISDTHLAGNQVLFCGTDQKLQGHNHTASQLLDVYNEIAPKWGFLEIRQDDLESSVSLLAMKKTEELEILARADALGHLGNSYLAGGLLLPLIEPADGARGLTSEAEGERSIRADQQS